MAYQVGLSEATQIDGLGVVHMLVTANATPVTLTTPTFTPANGEKGLLDITYTGVDADGAGKNIRRIVQYKKTAAGVLTIPTKTTGYTPTADSGYTNLDFDVVAVNGNVTFTVTGINNKDIRHSLQIDRNFSLLNAPN